VPPAGALVVNDGVAIALPATIRRDDVLGFLGYPPGRAPPPRTEALLTEVLEEARRLVTPRGAVVRLPAAGAQAVGLEPLIDAAGLVLGLCTAGAAIEERAGALAATDPTRALLLDAAGSAAAEEAADRLGALAVGAGSEASGTISCRVSPGYARWPLSAQQHLFELLPHEAIGVRLLPTFLMVPRKSISFAMWLGADARPLAGLSGCARCSLTTCRYRRDPRVSEELP
jgi:hypothetical protein